MASGLMSITFFILIFVCIVALLLGGKNKKPKQQHTPISAKPILTKRELQFFAVLEQALPHVYIFPQVSFSAILTTKGFSFGYDRQDHLQHLMPSRGRSCH